MKEDKTKVKKDELYSKVRAILLRTGLNNDETEACLRSWIYAETSEKSTHGFDRLPWLTDHIMEGKIKANVQPEISEKNLITKIIGKGSLGYLAAEKSTDRVISSTKKFGMGICTLYNSYPTGCLGQYTEKITENGLIGIAISSSPKKVAPYGGTSKVFSTTGHSFGFPGEKYPYIYDSSVSAITNGQLNQIRNENGTLPEKAVIGPNGEFTSDVKEIFDNANNFIGIIAPAGNNYSHRISGFAGSLELLTQLALLDQSPDENILGYSIFIAIDPTLFGSIEDYKRLVTKLQSKINSSGNQRKVFFAGERSYKARKENLKSDSISISNTTYEFLNSAK